MADPENVVEVADVELEAHVSSPEHYGKQSTSVEDDSPTFDSLAEDSEPSKDESAQISNKRRKEDSDAIDAETQRLLRESKNVTFPQQKLLHQPLSSVLEKMRQRKLQRALKVSSKGQGSSSRRLVANTRKVLSQDARGSLDLHAALDVASVAQEPAPQLSLIRSEEQITEYQHSTVVKLHASVTSPVESDSRPKTPERRIEGRSEDDRLDPQGKRESVAKVALIDTQDLYSDSQLSPPRDVTLPSEIGEDDLTRLHELVTDTPTDNSSLADDDEDKENKVPSSEPQPLPAASLVRGLIDDEAEDEDEDLLEEQEEGDDDDDGEDLRDMVVAEVSERPDDLKRRSNLHRKWLENHDKLLTDRLVNRIGNGWKRSSKKQLLPDILAESELNERDGLEKAQGSVDELARANSSTSVERIIGHGTEQKAMPEKSLPQHEDSENILEESDEEEEDERMKRQRLLDQSERESDLPSVHDDESSREIFSLISKANVTSIKTAKVSSGAHSNDIGHNLLTQSSFARRTGVIMQATTRHGSGTSRSFVFGRGVGATDQQSRSHSKDGASPSMNDSNNGKASSSSQANVSAPTESQAKASGSTGLSLFQILKQQAADLERSVIARDSSFRLNADSHLSGDLSIFSVMRPTKVPRRSKS